MKQLTKADKRLIAVQSAKAWTELRELTCEIFDTLEDTEYEQAMFEVFNMIDEARIGIETLSRYVALNEKGKEGSK